MPSPNEEKILDKNSPQNCSNIVSESPQQPEGLGSPIKSSFEDILPSPSSSSTPLNNNLALSDNLSADFSFSSHTSPSHKTPSLDGTDPYSSSSEPHTTSDRKNSKSEEITNVIISNNEPSTNAEMETDQECNSNTRDEKDPTNNDNEGDENDDEYYYSEDEESMNPSTHTHPPRTNSTPQIRKSRHTHSKITHVRSKSRSPSIHKDSSSNSGNSSDTTVTTVSGNIDGASEKFNDNQSNKANSSNSSISIQQDMEVEPPIPSGGRGRSNAFYIKPQLELPATTPGPSRGPPRPVSLVPPKEYSCSGIARLQNGIQLWRKSSAPLPHQIVNRSSRFLVGFAETIGKRSTMEDEIVIFGGFRNRETDDYFALFDGHGGKDAATFAARNLHEIISENLKNQMANSSPFANPVRALKESFRQTHESMSGQSIKGGTTAVVALFIGNTGYVANVGDSRAVLCRDGQAFRVSLDHKPELPKETERIQRQGGIVTSTVNAATGQQTFRVQGQLSVSRALGDTALHPYVSYEPDIHGPLNISPNHKNQFVILACDGVWDVVQDDEAVQLVQPFICGGNSCDPEQAALRLRDEAFARGSTDNISVIVIVFTHSLPKR
eukprot:TRINITY_DN3642_c0_g1_i1.p1 TRINITY_DN3642_c0_g1~~TRINITY_DN3642_c0_g1_i1.p1  ORF type:complete len:609 (+),score=132.67 TRINITY_DN3642_c0_g1_i1:647-2473(+)